MADNPPQDAQQEPRSSVGAAAAKSKEDLKQQQQTSSSSKSPSKAASRAGSKLSLKSPSKSDMKATDTAAELSASRASRMNLAPSKPDVRAEEPPAATASKSASRTNIAASPRAASALQQSTNTTANTPPQPSDSTSTSTLPPRTPLEKPPVGEPIPLGNPSVEIPTDGILPLFLTTMTQDLFKIKGHEDLTVDKPIKVIPKADLLADIQARLAISDFQPAKAAILEYPDEELLIQFDPDFKYGQNFFLYISPAAVDAVLRPPSIQKEEEANAKGKPKPKIWESLGSDREIDAEKVVDTRELVQIKVTRKRKDFGQAYEFTDRDATDTFWECKSFKDPNYEINRMELAMGVQAVPELIDRAAQTNWFRPVNFSTQYEPLTMDPDQRSAALGSEEMTEFVRSVMSRFEQALQQNAIMDIFADDFKALGEEDVSVEKGTQITLQEYQSFTDLKHSKDRSISYVDWHPTQRGVLAISCTNRSTFDDRIEAGFSVRSGESIILIWSFHDPIHPQLILEAPEDICSFQFNPADPNIIAGGCVNGQIVLWDISEYQDKLKSRKSSGKNSNGGGADDLGKLGKEEGGVVGEAVVVPVVKFAAASSIEFSHRSSIADLQWLPAQYLVSNNGEIQENPEGGVRQLVTASLDGQVCFWDTKRKDVKSLDMVWKPFFRLSLSSMDNTFDYGLMKISLKGMMSAIEKMGSEANIANTSEKPEKGEKQPPETNLTKFFAATEEGDLITADLVQEKTTEEKASRVEHCYSWHFGTVSDLQRSPFFPDILLSVGGWSFHIWKEKLTTGPLLSSAPSGSAYLIGGRWSPTRPGVFFISKSDGSVEIWDLLDRSNLPTSVQNVSSTAVSFMSVRQYPGKNGIQFIAAGDDEGTLHILEIPKNLTRPSKNEKSIVKTFFDREVRRLGYVTERKQFRIRERGKWDQQVAEALSAQKAAAAAAVQGAGQKKEEGAEAGAAAAPVAPPASGVPVGPPGVGQDDGDKLEQEYRKIEQNFLELEGLLIAA
ncbi:WD repeat-containing protein 63 [Chytridiales sp. JEL 0842]|nr:WD repeat-containing protein 63 [Chytridiales sp. JEL 0842]